MAQPARCLVVLVDPLGELTIPKGHLFSSFLAQRKESLWPQHSFLKENECVALCWTPRKPPSVPVIMLIFCVLST